MSEDILFDILLWLPVVSLLRFKRVCKSWLALIESSSFIKQHLHHHSGEDALIVSHVRSRNLDFCLFSGNKYEICTDIDFDDRLYRTIKADDWDVDLVDSCDGIICLHNDLGHVVLWNPALKQHRLLPKSSISDQCYNPEDVVVYNNIGFGFDAKANDYKVVSIWDSTMSEINRVEVYSLRTSFSWRTIHKNSDLPFMCILDYPNHATSKSGTCFWFGADNHDIILVAFNLKNEVFETMPLPDSHGSETCDCALDFLNEKLAYISGSQVQNPCFEIWVLHEFGVKESWNKIYNIGPTPHLERNLYPTGFSMNGEILLLTTTNGPDIIDELYFYDLGTRKATRESYIPVQEPNPCLLRSFLHYNESLVSLKNVANGGG